MNRRTLPTPAGDPLELKLEDLIDVPALQGIMEDFHVLSRFPMALIDLHGKVLVEVGWQRICTHFHRTHPEICKHCMESDTELTTQVPPGEFRLYPCKNGLWDCATPLMLGGRHVGNLFTGQFFLDHEPVDREFFRAQARQYGLDETAYLAALDAVPHMSRDMVNTCMAFLVKLAQTLSQLSYSNITLARLLAERDQAQLETATAGEFLKLINQSTTTRDLVHAALTFFHQQSGCEAVGLRLKKGDEYLGFEIRGDPEAFVQLEHSPFARCNGQGYESVALIALRFGDNRLGLLQVNDPRKGLFTAQKIALWERLASYLAVALAKAQAEEALRESELFYRQTLESIPGMVFTTRPDGYCDYQSQQWVDFTGIPMSQHMGDGWNKLLHPDDRIRAFEAWRAAVEGRASYDLEYRVRRHDGEYEWFKVLGRPILDANGKIVRWFGVAANINAMKSAEEELRLTSMEMARSNRELEHFAYIASHDLQEPLRAVEGFLGRLRDRYEDKLDSRAKEYIHFAVQGAQRMSQLVYSLLDYSRVQSVGLKSEWVPMQAVFDQAVANCASAIAGSGAVVTCDALPTVMGDAMQLVQLLQNLIGNAVKFRRAGIRPEVRVTARRQGAEWVFGIRDNGIGIPPAQLERVFLIFQRLHTQDEYPGAGIGLAICKKIMERHGGRIWAESRMGEGSQFLFSIQARQAEPPGSGSQDR